MHRPKEFARRASRADFFIAFYCIYLKIPPKKLSGLARLERKGGGGLHRNRNIVKSAKIKGGGYPELRCNIFWKCPMGVLFHKSIIPFCAAADLQIVTFLAKPNGKLILQASHFLDKLHSCTSIFHR